MKNAQAILAVTADGMKTGTTAHRSHGPGQWVFLLLLLLQLALVWSFPYFLTQDGPSHLDNANLLLRYRSSEAPRQYFELNLRPVPNWFGHLAEAALLAIAPPPVAEKALIGAYVLLLAFAFRYAVSAQNAAAVPAAAAVVLPLTFNCLLLYGFFNFCLGIGWFLVLSGYWIRIDRIRPRAWGVTAGLALLLYFTHIFTWFMAAMFVCVCGSAKVVAARWRVREAIRALSAFAPSVILAIWFFWTQTTHAAAAAAPVTLEQRWAALWRASTIVFSYRAGQVAISTSFGLLLGGFAIYMAVRRRWNIWTLMAALTAAAYFLAPPTSGIGQYVLERWNLFVLLSTALWVATEIRGRYEAFLLAALSAAISLAILVSVASQQRQVNQELQDYLSVAPAMAAGSTVLPVQFDSRGKGTLQQLYGMPMRHASGYIGAARQAIILDNYEAQTEVFPLRFLDRVNPGVFIGHMEDEPPAPRFAGYERTGGSVDYVLLWDPLNAAHGSAAWQAIETQLRGAYVEAAHSPNRAAVLYRRVTPPSRN